MMNYFINLLLFFIIPISFINAQTDSETIITIDETEISKAEFARIYKKNNNHLFDEADKKSPKDYMELFINFKLKVLEAENLKLDTNKAFIDELAGYRKDLAAPYLTDISYTEKMIKETYDRMKTEVKAAHILVSTDKNESDKAAYDKAIKIRNEILNGKSFDNAAVEYSDDPSAKTNKGSLGYFSAFQMVFPFENAAFNTQVGEISMPIKSSFGYHLIKVSDKRPTKGEIKVAHIMKIFPQNATDKMKAELKVQIDSIYKRVKGGEDFSELAKSLSDDKRTSAQGGELPWFSSARMIADFAEPAFALENNGDISEPVSTQFGYHIIKRIDHRGIKAFDEMKVEIENRIKKDPERSKHNQNAFVEKLKKGYNFKVYEANRDACFAALIENNDVENKELFSLNGSTFNTESFSNYLKEQNVNSETKGFSNKLKDLFHTWVNKEIIDHEDSMLEQKHPDFRYLMQEYHDGILLFNLSDTKIWTFAMQDSVGLQKYYEDNPDKYSWEERFKGSIIKCIDQETKDKVDTYLEENIPINEILELVNDSNNNRVTIDQGAWEHGSNAIVDYFVWDDEKPADLKEGLEFVRGDKIGPEPKNLEEARGLYISDYQNFLEKNWIKELRKKYKIKINKKVLKTVKSA